MRRLNRHPRVARRRASPWLCGVFTAVASSSCTVLFPVHEGQADGGADARARLDGSPEGDGEPASTYRDAVLADGPAVYLRFGEKSGSTAADETGTFDGVFSGGITYGVPGAISGDPDTAVAFDGVAAVRMPAGLDFAGTAPFTIELWAKQSGYLGFGLTVDHARYDSQNRNGWMVRFGEDRFGLERWVDDATRGSTALSDGPLPLNEYHHVVTTFDGEAARLYVDGALSGAPSALATSLEAVGGGWTVGAQNCMCSGQGFAGVLDEVAVYPKALSGDRILVHFNLGRGTTTARSGR